jgi:uncharacterized protein YbjT (DUF2867 family)
MTIDTTTLGRDRTPNGGPRRTVLVTGATGAQGGSMARHLLDRGGYAVRALTRNPGSEAARALAAAGAEVVAGDLADRASLRAALAGCQAVFGGTNFWEHFAAEHGRNLVNAVAGAEIEHFVFSSLELQAPHHDTKAEVAAYARSLGLPLTLIAPAFFYENFLGLSPPRPRADGSLALGFNQGDTPLAAVAAEDVGGVVVELFERPQEFLGRTVGLVGDNLPCADYAETMTRVLGRRVVYQPMTRDEFAGLGFPGADDLAAMFELDRIRVPSRRADLEECRALYPAMQSFETWLVRNRGRFEALLAA